MISFTAEAEAEAEVVRNQSNTWKSCHELHIRCTINLNFTP